MSERPLFDPRDFIIADGIAHLCAGGETAPLHRHAAALTRYLRDKSRGMAGRIAQEAEIARARASIARCWVVDFTQAAGYLPIEASIADFAFSACYKWLLGITGVAIAYWNRARQPGWTPASAGWYSFEPGSRSYDNPLPLRDDALRFTRGNPAHASIYVLADALDYLAAYEVRDVQAHVQGMTTAMLERLESLRIPTLTPADPARHGASVCISSSRAQSIVDAMARRGVLAWNGQGRIRLSFHGYNSRRDVDQAISALTAEWA